MLDGIFRSNFRSKCKSLLNRIKTRLEVIKQRRNAMHKFLKKDIADLLKSNLDRNAYGRKNGVSYCAVFWSRLEFASVASMAEGLYMELMLSSCYEFVEQCCACITQNLKAMYKQSECPEQCRVAVASLIYAAARLADLPELCALRNHFIDKYGKTIESFVQKEFMETLKSRPPTTHMKLQLMQEIAQEFSITWDYSHLEQYLKSSSPATKSASEKGVNGGSQHWFRNRSTLGQGKGKQVDNTEEEAVIPKTRRHNSCTVFQENVTDKIHDQNHLQEETFPENNSHRQPITNRNVPAPYVKSSINTNEDKNQTNEDDDGSFGNPKPRPKSVRTMFLKPSASTNHGLITSSNSEHEVDPRENLSARVTREKRNELFSDKDEEEEAFENLSTKLCRKTPLGSSSARKEDNETPKFYLLPPPGKRRYFFSNSAPGSPTKADNLERKSTEKSKFLTPEEQKAEMVKASVRHVRSNSGHQVHPKLPDYDKITEMFTIMNNV